MHAEPPEAFEPSRKPRPGLRRLIWASAATLTAVLFAISLLPIPSIAHAQSDQAENSQGQNGQEQSENGQDDAVVASVTRFLRQQTVSLGDQVSIEVRDSAANLGKCPAPQPFLPRPGVPQGRVTVGVHCGGDGGRTRYVQATVSAQIKHLVALEPIDAGQRIDASSLGWQQSDISRLRRGYLDDIAQASGMVATRRISDGTALTDSMLRQPWMVKRGDTVVLTAIGQGFRVSRNVEALDNGGLGSTIRLKTESNQILQGKVTGQDRLSVEF